MGSKPSGQLQPTSSRGLRKWGRRTQALPWTEPRCAGGWHGRVFKNGFRTEVPRPRGACWTEPVRNTPRMRAARSQQQAAGPSLLPLPPYLVVNRHTTSQPHTMTTGPPYVMPMLPYVPVQQCE